MSRLQEDITKAIADDDIKQLNKLLTICDLLHKGAPKYEGYVVDDLPTDMKYEEAKTYLRDQELLNLTISNKNALEVSNKSKIDRSYAKANKDVLMYMDGIQITETIPNIKNVILMPKFDGCSVGTEFIKSGDNFIINKAHTRGTDNLNGSRKCQDKTEYIKSLFVEQLNNINKIINNKELDLNITIKYKDVKLLGNNNKPLKTKIDLHYLDNFIIRGEFVSNDKNNINNPSLPSTAIGLAAGALNAKFDKFNDYKPYITYIPFEISNIKIRDDDNITEYIPTQETALKILRKLKLITYKTYQIKEIDESFNMEDVLTTMEAETLQPLDGVVYCSKNWTYPLLSEETSKRVNYAKYKWKRHNTKQTKIINIDYSIGKTGKLTPSFIFSDTIINNKTYKHAKTTFKNIDNFIKDCKEHKTLFGKGLVCELELMSDISPQITKIFPTISKVNKEIKLIKKCPYCGETLTYENKTVAKQKIINVLCLNDKCYGVLSQKCRDFLSQIGYKGISTKTLENLKYNSFEQLYKDKLKKEYKDVGKKEKIIYSSKTVNNKLNKKLDFIDILINLNVKQFLISTSLFTKSKVNNFLKELDINETDILLYNINNHLIKNMSDFKYNENYDKLKDYLLNKTNYFIKDLTTFIIETDFRE